jgi:putative flippase GtrA
MPDFAASAARAVRYGLAGLVNTAIGLSIIYTLDLGLHVPPQIANTAGYVLGAGVGFVLNKVFVFRSPDRVSTTGWRYVTVVLVGWALNQGLLKLALTLLPPSAIQHAVAQLIGMASYTVFAFLGCQLWVFRDRRPPSADTSAHLIS